MARSERAGRLKTWLGRLLVMAVAAGIGLVAVEIGLRLFGLAPAPGIFTVTAKEFARIPGIFAPNQRATLRAGLEFEHHITIDSLGYRGPDFPRSKPVGEYRILYAGDSFTFGHNVDDDETTPAQLEERLGRRCGAVRVINAGLSGSSILAQSELVVRGLALDPDAVVIMFHENDIDELITTRMWEALAVNRQAKSRFPLSFIYPIARRTALWNLALDVTQSMRLNASVPPAAAGRPDTLARKAAAREEYATRLGDVAQRLSVAGIPFVFGLFPHPESVRAGKGGDDYEWVLNAAHGMGLTIVDLLPWIVNSGVSVEDAYLVPLDYHPSPRGHGLAADRIASWFATALGPARCVS